MTERGWMPGVEHVPTEAFGYADLAQGSMQPIAVMSHVMQGYQRTMLAWARERPSSTPKSAHFTIGREGHVAQHVGIFDAAWTAGYVAHPSWPLYRPGTNPNRYLVHIEHEGFSAPPGYGFDFVYDDARPWPDAMVAASIEVQRWVLAQTGIEAGPLTVIGHRETDSVNRALDPGSAWPQARIIEALRASSGHGGASGGTLEVAPGAAYEADLGDLAWPHGAGAQLIQAVLEGRVGAHEYVCWHDRVLPSVVVLPR